MRRRTGLATLLFSALAAAGSAQDSAAPAGKPAAWALNASLYGYFPPEDVHYAQPTVMADHGALHLEARYNYEALKSGSAWVGWNLSAGKELTLNATLLAGGVVGDLRGVAPGYELTLTWKAFQLYSEGEYVFDTSDSSGDFFYNWAQLGWSPWEWLSVGLASQRTRVYHTSLDVQRGVFVGFTWKSLSLNVFVFNPGWKTPTVVSSLAVSF
ncbi:MAG TPA: hypothetical protein VMH79_15715 [Thermoanaerobaculia bacterium]|nr:hypothetical protein [Thermoanaerobaculia bacterium]